MKKLMARHRALRLGVGLLGASALAVGFASPALAAESSGGNGPALNYNIYQGGSNTAYLMMTGIANLFNESPGCDLASSSGTTQPLDYGCPGLNDSGTTLSTPQTVAITGNITKKKSAITVTSGVTTGIFANDAITDTGGAFAANGTTVTSVTTSGGTTTINVAATALKTVSADTFTVTTTPAVGENGFTTFAQQNPFNDLLVEEPSLGSSNGIAELEDQGAHGVNLKSDGQPVGVAPLDVARSSRAPNLTTGSSNGDDKGLNFVAYAMDAVTWLHWTSVGSKATPSASVTTIPTTGSYTLTSIWENQGCTVGSTTYTSANWACVPGGTAGPIDVYMAQNGSGTESTWATLLGLSGSFPYGGEDPNHVIFENETSSILANKDEANAIFFFSYGKFQTICAPDPTMCSGSSKNKVALGEINGIKASKGTINAELPGSTTTPFPGDRYLYNVYSNGSNNSNIPESSPAALNAVSEDGFMCKPSTATDVDPNTGATYHSEISAVISGQGFYPMPLMVEDGQGATSGILGTTGPGIPHPAWTYASDPGGLQSSNYSPANEAASPWNFPAGSRDDDNSAVSGTYKDVYFNGSATTTQTATATDPVGYCLTMTTDGNTAS